MSEPKTVGDILDALPAPREVARQAQPITPMQMLQTAVERGADIAMLEKLLSLQERWEANEARKAFVRALSAFKSEPPTITKDKSASFGSAKGATAYDYATLDQVASVIGASLSRHGLSHRWETGQVDGKIKVTCVLTHELGHSERVTLEAGADTSGSKNAIQAIGSTVTYLERYTLLAVTGLAAKEQDNDARTAFPSQFITSEQKDELIALMKETGADTKRFLAYLAVPSVDEIPAAEFGNAKAALEKKRGAHA